MVHTILYLKNVIKILLTNLSIGSEGWKARAQATREIISGLKRNWNHSMPLGNFNSYLKLVRDIMWLHGKADGP